jgi:hypothetical protein
MVIRIFYNNASAFSKVFTFDQFFVVFKVTMFRTQMASDDKRWIEKLFGREMSLHRSL